MNEIKFANKIRQALNEGARLEGPRGAADVEELDAQLLTGDLPIDAYLDRGFEAWLKKVSSNSSNN